MDVRLHTCGGTILTGASGSERHHYCDRCGAYIYASEGGPEDVPSGTDAEANRAAYDAGEDRSPEAP